MKRFTCGVEALESRSLLSAGVSGRAWGAARRVAVEASPSRLTELTLAADLDAASDPLGDGTVFQAKVVVTGQTLPGAVVRASRGATGRPVVADANGQFRMALNVPEGTDGVTLQVRDRWGRTALTVVDATRGNAVLAWNAAALEAIRRNRTSPPVASRALAIVQASVYDAVNAVTPVGPDYMVDARAARGTSASAAAVGAAHASLVALFPTQTALFDAALAQSLAGLGRGGRGVAAGLALGESVATQIVSARADDGSATAAPYSPGADPGDWRPTPPAFAGALLPGWPGVETFVIPSADAFRPDAPPALTTVEYAAALNEVKAIGSVNSAVRTAEQTEIARFWADGAGTATPPGHWNVIASDLSRSRREPLARSAQTLAMLDLALADAAIACWDAKYAYDLWRPVTAIREAGADGNPETTADPTWAPLIVTPPFPSHTSGHSTFSTAAAVVLAARYGNNVRFQTTSDGLPGVTRTYSSFSDAAAEAGMSRIYGGIHYAFDNVDGQDAGRAIGRYVLASMGRRG